MRQFIKTIRGGMGRGSVGAIAGTLFFLTAAGSSQAQLLTNLSIGNPKALGLANAVTADPPGVDSIHFNPAGLSRIRGREANFKFLAAKVDLHSEFGQPTLPGFDYKKTFYAFNTDCQQNLPLVNSNRDDPSNAPVYDECWGVDPVGGAQTDTGSPIVMLPFLGVQKVPILGFPSGGMAFQDSGNNWVFGSAVYVPEGIGYTREPEGPGAYQGQRVALSRITYFSPTIGLQLTDDFSIGFGINFSYQGMYVQTKFRAPSMTLGYLKNLNSISEAVGNGALPPIEFGPYDNAGLLTMEMQDYLSVGFNFGMLWDAYPWLTLGMVYHSESKASMSGDFTMENSDKFLATTQSLGTNPLVSGLLLALGGARLNAIPVEKGTVKMDYIVPQNLAFGASVKVLPDLKVNVDVKWADYSRWESLDFQFDRNVDFLSFGTAISSAAGFHLTTPSSMVITRNYKDTWSLALGMEYQLDYNLVLRAGYEPRTSAIPSNKSDLIFPIGDVDLYTGGIGWQYDKVTRVDAALGYLHSSTYTPACKSQNANSCIDGNVVYNPYFATPFKNEVNGYLAAISVDRKF